MCGIAKRAGLGFDEKCERYQATEQILRSGDDKCVECRWKEIEDREGNGKRKEQGRRDSDDDEDWVDVQGKLR